MMNRFLRQFGSLWISVEIFGPDYAFGCFKDWIVFTLIRDKSTIFTCKKPHLLIHNPQPNARCKTGLILVCVDSDELSFPVA